MRQSDRHCRHGRRPLKSVPNRVIPHLLNRSLPLRQILRHLPALLTLAVLTACGQPGQNMPPDTPYDPFERRNRNMHAFNQGLDRSVIRPVARGYSAFMPDDIETLVGRFADNASLPSYVLNNILRGDMITAGQDMGRFVVNTTIGLGGFFDPASDFNMPAASKRDFGHVLYAWGFDEGAYLENPVVGPTTVRDLAGRVIGIVTNPVGYVVPSPESFAITGAKVSDRLSDRVRYGDTIDSILHDSADSYAQMRLLYLQNRRYELSGGTSSTYQDPYGAQGGTASPQASASSTYKDPYDD